MVLSKLKLPTIGAERSSADRFPDGAPKTFPQLLEDCRRTWGDKTAFQEKRRRQWLRVSHNDVHRRAYEAAAGFAALGLQRGERVAIIMENGIDWVLAYHATVLNGAIAVPIYYDLKTNEIEAMLRHSDPSMVVVGAKPYGKLRDALSTMRAVLVAGDDAPVPQAPGDLKRQASPDVLPLSQLESRATPESRRAVAAIEIEPDDLASIVFTSGTSGGSKGVMLTHMNFMANSRSVQRSIPFGGTDRIVMALPLHHAFPFIITLGIAPNIGGEVTFENDLRRIRDRMAEVKPTIFIAVPAMLDLMYRNIVHSIETQGRLETFEKGLKIVEATKQRTGINLGRIVFRELHKRLGSSLRFMVSGGAALNPQTARDFAILGVPIIQGWGLSEAAPVLSAQRWNPRKFYMSNHYEERFGSIGQAVEGVEVGLIDVPEKELYVHLHGEGELVARGENITPGYWRAEEESAAIKVGEWLRTGDVGRIDEEGNIWITGRSKFVIVLESGEKVHPDEVEEKLELSPFIEDIVILGRKARGKTQINAVIYPNRDAIIEALAGEAATEASVRRVIGEAIDKQEEDVAAFKRVVDFMLTDEPLPRTPIRKVMRGHIRDTYAFDPPRWERSWQEFRDATTPEPDPETEDALAPA